MNLLIDLNNQGTTIVMVTHLHACAGLSKRIIQLLDGEIIGEKAPANA